SKWGGPAVEPASSLEPRCGPARHGRLHVFVPPLTHNRVTEKRVADWKRRLLGLGLPCLLAFLLDTGLRLRAQPEAYWAGNYHFILQEGSPFLRALYTWHPLAAVAGYALWAAIITGLLVLLPEWLAVILSLAIGVGHIGGAHSWLKPTMGTWRDQLEIGTLLV